VIFDPPSPYGAHLPRSVRVGWSKQKEKTKMGGFRYATWFRACNRLSPVECSVGNRFRDPMAIGHPGRLLEFKQGVLLWLTDCQRSTVILCLGRLLESPGFGYRLPPRLPQPLLCSGRPVNLKGLVILSAWAWKSLNPLGRDWKIERKVRTLYGCQIYDVRHNRPFREKASRTIVVVCDHQRLPGQRASSRDPSLG